jgi:hypothetical protein
VRLLALVLGMALLLAAAVAAAPSVPAKQVKRTNGFIESLAIDGSLVAYDVQGAQPKGPECNRVYAWNLATKRVTRVSGRGTCDADNSSTGAGVAQLAVAGSRLAWIVNVGGNSESSDRLYTSALPAARERRLAAVSRFGNVDCVLAGRWLGGLVGSGSLLAYNIWATVPDNAGDESSCATKTTSAALRKIGTRGTTLVRSGLDTLFAADANAGRIAVARRDGTVALLSATGAPLQTIGVEPPKELALAGNRLVVLGTTRRIQVYDVRTGRSLLGPLVPAGAQHLDAAGGIAAYAVARRLHVLRLATGVDTVVATAPKPIAGLAVSNRALAYAFNVFKRIRKPPSFRDIGNVAVIPISRLVK